MVSYTTHFYVCKVLRYKYTTIQLLSVNIISTGQKIFHQQSQILQTCPEISLKTDLKVMSKVFPPILYIQSMLEFTKPPTKSTPPFLDGGIWSKRTCIIPRRAELWQGALDVLSQLICAWTAASRVLFSHSTWHSVISFRWAVLLERDQMACLPRSPVFSCLCRIRRWCGV